MASELDVWTAGSAWNCSE